MKKTLLLLPFLALIPLTGCESKSGTAVLGGAAGAAAGAGAYEYKGEREMDRVEGLYQEGKIDRREYEIRKDQIQRDFMLQR